MYILCTYVHTYFECGVRFSNFSWSYGTYHACLGIATQRWLKNTGQLGITEWHMKATENVQKELLSLAELDHHVFILFSAHQTRSLDHSDVKSLALHCNALLDMNAFLHNLQCSCVHACTFTFLLRTALRWHFPTWGDSSWCTSLPWTALHHSPWYGPAQSQPNQQDSKIKGRPSIRAVQLGERVIFWK